MHDKIYIDFSDNFFSFFFFFSYPFLFFSRLRLILVLHLTNIFDALSLSF